MPENPPIPNIKACVFDAYGTLFDVHSAVGQHMARLGDAATEVSTMWRTKQLEYTWLRSLMKKHVDFWQITQDGLDYALDASDISDRQLRNDLIEAYLQLNCYPEVPDILAILRKRGLLTAILSNGSPAMLDAVVKSSGLQDLIQTILSVESVGVFKPVPDVYQLAVDHLGVAAPEIIFLSSNSWDAVGATAFGFKVAWINRFDQRPERMPFQPEAEIKTLAELPGLLEV